MRDVGPHPPQQSEIVIPLSPPDKPMAYENYAFQIVISAFSAFGFPLSTDRFESLKRFFATQSQNTTTQLKIHLTIAGDDISKIGLSFLVRYSDEGLEEIQRIADSLGLPETQVRFAELQVETEGKVVEFSVSHLKSEYSYGVYTPGWNIFLAWSNF